jgi:hypothetical protein
LFRHLHEPRSLRRNPFVRRILSDAGIGNFGSSSDRAVLNLIHHLVREGANHCRDADLAAGKDERALRQHAIVMLQCLAQRKIREVAAELGISYQHCYRERAEICRRLARYISEQKHSRVALVSRPEWDEFQLLAWRTLHRTAYCDAVTAFRICDELTSVAQSAQQSISAFCIQTETAIRFGDLRRAKQANAAARALYADQTRQNDTLSWRTTESCLDISSSRLAHYAGEKLEALSLAELAATRLRVIQWSAAPHVKELYAQSLFELGVGFWNLGELERAYEYLCLAEASLCDARAVSIQVRTQVMLSVWKIRNSLLIASKTWFPSYQRLAGLSAAFDQAYASGLILESIDALLAIAQYHAFAGNDDEALRPCRRAQFLAGQQYNERILTNVALEVVTILQRTRYSGQAYSFMPATLLLCDDFHREVASYVAAKNALQSRRPGDAWFLATNACERKKYFMLTTRQEMVAAQAASRLGRRREAHTMIESAVSAAEKLGSAAVLRDAYVAAADVTADAQFRRKAGELKSLLSA